MNSPDSLVVTPMADVLAPFAGIPTYTPEMEFLEFASIIFPEIKVKFWENEEGIFMNKTLKMKINFFTIVEKILNDIYVVN